MKTIQEFAEQKGCSRQTIYLAIKQGNITPVKKFGKQLIPENAKNMKWEPKLDHTPQKYK